VAEGHEEAEDIRRENRLADWARRAGHKTKPKGGKLGHKERLPGRV